MGFKIKKAPKKEGKIEEKKASSKVFIENYCNQKDPVKYAVKLVDGQPKTGVFIGGCKNSTIILEGKCKNVTISGCQGCGILFEACVTTVEVINSKRCQIQGSKQAGTFTIDKCDRTKVYLPAGSCKGDAKAMVYTTGSSATCILFPDEKGEQLVEYGIPEQIQTVFQIGKKPITEVIIPES